jgi:hypothetical protein
MAAKPGKAGDGKTGPQPVTGARHPGRPGTQTGAQRDGKAPNGQPPMSPDY